MSLFTIKAIRTTAEAEMKVDKLKGIFLQHGVRMTGEKIRVMAINTLLGTLESLEKEKLQEFISSIKKGEEHQIWKS